MRILVGYVDSPEGKAAVDAAVAEARLRSAEVVVVGHVRVRGAAGQAEEAKTARDTLDGIAEEIRRQGVPCRTHWSLGLESAASALLAYAEQEEADLIVLGIRRRTPVGKLVLGSNAQDVLLKADCPVLAVKASRGD